MLVKEVDDLTLNGSFSSNLIENKFWALTSLSQIKNTFSTIYILGSWFGNAALMFSMDPRFTFKKIINVDVNKAMLATSKKLAELQGDDRISHMRKDANNLTYQQLDKDGLVVNFSCTNIRGNDWFANIPSGTMVLLSGRNNDPGAINKFNSLKEFSNKYPLSKTLFIGSDTFEDPETEYECYLVIGIK